jgi:hypothetical protein
MKFCRTSNTKWTGQSCTQSCFTDGGCSVHTCVLYVCACTLCVRACRRACVCMCVHACACLCVVMQSLLWQVKKCGPFNLKRDNALIITDKGGLDTDWFADCYKMLTSRHKKDIFRGKKNTEILSLCIYGLKRVKKNIEEKRCTIDGKNCAFFVITKFLSLFIYSVAVF